MKSRGCAVVIGLVALLLVASPAHAGPRTLHLGFLDESVLADPDAAVREQWLTKIRSAGARRMRINVVWSKIATRAPHAGENPSDPAWTGYSWEALDNAVSHVRNHGLVPILTFLSAPEWAEGAGRPASVRPGAWRPEPRALAAFARAAATRYPAVRYWQAWNEPNLSIYLAPQWEGSQAVAPAHYRRMLNAFYGAVKQVARRNVVVSAGTAPFGDDPGGNRMRPAAFVRSLLCLRGPSLRKARCPRPARFDVLAHHPYSIGGPARLALNRDDVSVPDMRKLTRPLRLAERTGRARGATRHRVWVTEMGWDSSPADPEGVPAGRHARWLQHALYVLWRSGVDTVIWLLARDQAPVPSFADTYQSGIFLRDGEPKLAAASFAFPFVGLPASKGRARLWGKAPAAGLVTIQRRSGSGWRTLTRVRPRGMTHLFEKTVRVARGSRLRARSGSRRSLTWTVGRD